MIVTYWHGECGKQGMKKRCRIRMINTEINTKTNGVELFLFITAKGFYIFIMKKGTDDTITTLGIFVVSDIYKKNIWCGTYIQWNITQP